MKVYQTTVTTIHEMKNKSYQYLPEVIDTVDEIILSSTEYKAVSIHNDLTKKYSDEEVYYVESVDSKFTRKFTTNDIKIESIIKWDLTDKVTTIIIETITKEVL